MILSACHLTMLTTTPTVLDCVAMKTLQKLPGLLQHMALAEPAAFCDLDYILWMSTVAAAAKEDPATIAVIGTEPSQELWRR